ncbi:phosphoglycerate mutase [Candidatus Woesearchaeota archaeon]|jgi:2,3-bisphosphoglycerate-independent phosphoglycerate mutase|nr:phosphoglycerate mutase [Candidatus Woesearchaeota archaeon]|tara:strand:+ start:6677 stop:7903 length:1227 start_codon:yes stop_codon:yes gene_type:complete
MKKIILIICDGMGDIPEKELGDKTPLEAANTPNLDRFAREGLNGVMEVLGKDIRPNSDEAHLTLFGYDLKKDYPGRGPIEAAGVGIGLRHGDVAVRSNLATVDKELRVKDRRSGRMQDNHPFTKELDGIKIEGIEFIVKSGTGHRVIIVMRGKGLSDKISNSDVHYVSEEKVVEEWKGSKVNKIEPTDDTPEAKFTAKVLQKFLEISHESFEKNPENEKREKQGKLRGNYLLTRGPGYYKKLKSFEERYGLKSCCIAGAGLYKGLGAISGMEVIKVEGATGLIKTNLKAKIDAVKEQIKKYDFAYVHMKGADICGENGDCKGKKNFIEKIDQALDDLKDFEGIIAVTADHSTPCSHKDHSADPVPVLIHGGNITPDKVEKFNEIECAKGSLGTLQGSELMAKIMELAK